MRSSKVVVLMAGAALFRGYTHAANAAADVHSVRMAAITLAWIVSSGMAIDAARVTQHRDERRESRGVAGFIVGGNSFVAS